MPDPRATAEKLLGSIAPLRDARLERRLPGGQVSDNWLVEAGTCRYKLRIDRPAARELGLDRNSELRVLESIAGSGLGPDLVWADVENGILLCTWIEGESWDLRRIQQPDSLCSLAGTLRRLHRPAPGLPEFRPADALRRYRRMLSGARASDLAIEGESLLQKLEVARVQAVLCHNDPVHGNIVGGKPPRLIDWEYAAVGDPMFDLAVVIRHHDLSKEFTAAFLEAYYEKQSSFDRDRLAGYCRLYDLLSALWYAAMNAEGGRDAVFASAGKAARLRAGKSGRGYGLPSGL